MPAQVGSAKTRLVEDEQGAVRDHRDAHAVGPERAAPKAPLNGLLAL